MKRCLILLLLVLATVAVVPSVAGAAGYTYKSSFGSVGDGDGQFGNVMGMDYVAANDRLYVADWTNGRIIVYDGDGGFVDNLGVYGTGPGTISNPNDVDMSGDIWVSDDYAPKIIRLGFGSAHEFLLGQDNPAGLAVGNDGSIWVCTTRGVRNFTSGTFELLHSFAGVYADLTVTPHGNLYCTDYANNRVLELTADGEFVREIAGSGTAPGQVRGPWSIDITSDGIVVGDDGNDRVQILSSGPGTAAVLPEPPDHGGFDEPDVVAAGGGRIYVCDSNVIRCYSTQASGPTITGFAPTSGPAGTKVTITGQGFVGVNHVTFNGGVASFTVDSPTQITATVPDGGVSGAINVLTATGTATSTDRFTVTWPEPASITGFSPFSGPAGTKVTITGKQFVGVTYVTLNHGVLSFTVDSPTQITATIADGVGTGLFRVMTATGIAISGMNFTVTVPKITPVLTKSPRRSAYTLTRRKGEAHFTYAVTVTVPGGGPAIAKKVILQRSVNGVKWRTKATLTADSLGKASKRLTFTTRGTTYWRWYAPAEGPYTKATASKTKLVVR